MSTQLSQFTRTLLLLLAVLLVAMAGQAVAKSVYLIANHHTRAFDAWNIGAPGTMPPITYQATYNLSHSYDPGAVVVWVDPTTDPPQSVLFITSEFDNGLEMVDGRTMTSLGWVNGANGLAGVTMDDVNNIVYTNDRDSDDLYGYTWDPVARTLTPIPGINPVNLPNCAGSFGIDLDDANGILWVADTRGQRLRAYDVNTWTEVRTVTLSHIPMAVRVDTQRGFVYTASMNQRVVYCASNPFGSSFGSTLLSQYNIATGVETVVNMGYGGADVAVDEATGWVYVTEGCEGDRLTVWDPSTTPFSMVYAAGTLGSPAGIAIGNASFNPLNLAKNGIIQGTGVSVGDVFTYEITCDNSDNALDVTGVMIVDDLPDELDFVSEAVDGVPGTGVYDPMARTVTWNLGTLAAGSPGPLVELIVGVNANATPGSTIYNYATITSDQTPPTTVIPTPPPGCEDCPPGTPVLDCFSDLPAPILEVVDCEESSGNYHYSLNVLNYDAYPQVFFDPAPHLPPCGLNTNSSRAWVEIYAGDGTRLYGYCALDEPAGLNEMWFTVVAGNPVPENVYIEIIDRECDMIFTSNLAPTDVVSCGVGSIVGTVWSDYPAPGTGMMGVAVDLYNGGGTLVGSVMTDAAGGYEMTEIPNGDYTVVVQVPLGYVPVSDGTVAVAVNSAPVTVDFQLEMVASKDTYRCSFYYWKQQVQYLHDGTYPWRVEMTKEQIEGYLAAVFTHFYGRPDGYAIQIEGVTYVDDPPRAMLFDGLYDVFFEAVYDGSYPAQARRGMLTVMLDFAAGYLPQGKVASADGATYSQALTYLVGLYLTGTEANAQIAYENLKLMWRGKLIPDHVIPLSTPNIMYKDEDTFTPAELLPAEFALEQNYPNPFNPVTEIKFAIPSNSRVTLEVFNVVGQRVETLLATDLLAGHHVAVWDASDAATGVYFYRLTAGEFVQTRKMVLLK